MSDHDEGQDLKLLLKEFCDITAEQFAAAHPEEFLECDFEYRVMRDGKKVQVHPEQLTIGELRTLGTLLEAETAILKKISSDLVQRFILENFEMPQ